MTTRCLGTQTYRCARLIPRGSRCPSCVQSYRGTWGESTAWRNAVLARDRFTCQECGLHDPTGKRLQADHVVPLAAGGAKLDVTNGRCLCVRCHSARTKEAVRR